MKKTSIIITLLMLILTSCSNKEDNSNKQDNNFNYNRESNVKVESIWLTNWSTMKFEEKKVEVKVNNNELIIKWKTTIKEWRADDFPWDFKIISDWKIYQNSNMQKYAFIVVKNKSVEEIWEYYKKDLELNGWSLEKSDELENLNTQEEEKTIDFLKFTKKVNDIKLEELTLKINSEIPNILKEGFNLEWNFVEILYKDIFIESALEEEKNPN